MSPHFNTSRSLISSTLNGQGYRAQIDRKLYKREMQHTLSSYPNLSLRKASVEDVVLSDPAEGGGLGTRKVIGLRVGKLPWLLSLNQRSRLTLLFVHLIDNGEVIPCKSIVISTGTFLGGETHIGMETTPFGRINEPAAFSLSRSLREAGFELGRLKTGTPPRLRKGSIRFEGLGVQQGDMPAKPFSFLSGKVENEVSLSLVSTSTSRGNLS